jgi:hypothetical protein
MPKMLDIGELPNIKFIQIQTHSRCNANCVFCPYIESDHAANPGRMDDKLWHHILASLRPFAAGINQGKVCPYLMQEPLIDHTIFDKINDIYRCFPETCVEISTNGMALTDKVVDKLFTVFEGKRQDLWVSHHGIDKDTLEHIMKIDFEKAQANLINLLKKNNGRYHIKIRGAGQSRVGGKVFFTRRQYLDHWHELFAKHGISRKNVDIDAFTFHDRAGTLHRKERGACDLNMGTQRVIDKDHPFHCGRIDEWLHIGWDGRLIICCMDYHREIELPNLQDVWLLDYFQSDAYRNLCGWVSGQIPHPDNFICARCTSPGG